MGINIALLQMTGCGLDRDASRKKGELYCRRAKAMGADIALFPEMWSVGMTFYEPNQVEERARWQAEAIDRDDAFIEHFRSLAKEFEYGDCAHLSREVRRRAS